MAVVIKKKGKFLQIKEADNMRKNLGAKPMLVPQRVMMIVTYDADGNANVMNAAWC